MQPSRGGGGAAGPVGQVSEDVGLEAMRIASVPITRSVSMPARSHGTSSVPVNGKGPGLEPEPPSTVGGGVLEPPPLPTGGVDVVEPPPPPGGGDEGGGDDGGGEDGGGGEEGGGLAVGVGQSVRSVVPSVE